MRALLAKRHWQACLLGFFIVRVVAVWNRPLARFPDTIGYEKFSLFGQADRFWPITFIYWLVRNDTARVVLQVGIQVLAFALLATAVAALCGQRVWTGIPILAVACTPQITRFDLTILSESLGLSYLAFALGAIVLVMQKRTAATIALAIISIGLFAMTRPPQFLALAVATPTAIILAVRFRSRLATASAVSFVVLTVWGAVQLRNNQPMSTLVYYTVLADHVVPNPSTSKWFAAHGMPLSDEILSSRNYVYPRDLSPELLRELRLPDGQMPPTLMKAGGLELASWVKSKGWSTYARFAMTHPVETWRILDARWDDMLNPADADLLPVSPRVVVPRVVFGNVLWWILAAVATTIFLVIAFGWTPLLSTITGLALMTVVWFIAIAHTSGIEHGRHAITVAVATRLLAIITIVYTVSRYMDQRTHNA